MTASSVEVQFLDRAYSKSPEELYKHFNLDEESGLTESQVKTNREKYGRNETPKDPPTPLWVLIAKQFEDKLVIILILAALISLVLAFFEEGEEQTTAFFEPLVIFLILFANATVGVLQESSAEDAVEALKEYETPHAAVLRGGIVKNIASEELVPGDIVEVAAGDMVPADIRIATMSSSALSAEQSAITGESKDVAKDIAAIDNPNAVLQDKRNVLFAGSTVTRGKARGVVVGTGLRTETGKIKQALSNKKTVTRIVDGKEVVITQKEEEKFPLKERLDKFGDQLTWAIGVVCALVWAINIGHFSDPAFGGPLKGAIYYFKIAVSLAVAAIPEGLPAVITTCLALGTQRMAKKQAIVTCLPAVETLGCTNVICSDKTGTLTTNQMSVQAMFVIDANKEVAEFSVQGDSFATSPSDGSGVFSITLNGDSAANIGDGKSIDAGSVLSGVHVKDTIFQKVAEICALCNESTITYHDDKGYEKVGQSTEAALKVLVEKIPLIDGLGSLSTAERTLAVNRSIEERFEKQYTLEFNRDRKSMSVVVKRGNETNMLIKGAWDNVLARCNRVLLANGEVVSLNDALKSKIEAQANAYCGGTNSFRCLSLAYKDSDVSLEDIKSAGVAGETSKFAEFEKDAVFVGVCGIIDPPRAEVKGAIEKCRRAGIRVVVITGDNIETATAICRKIGVFGDDEDVTGKAFTGAQFKKFPLEKRAEIMKTARLFARVEPIDKKEMVEALHMNKSVVAMTGDGVNDAPALKQANIGIAMGTGTAVAKGAAKMVLADDNFATIVEAIEEGRNIYNNTKQFIRYLITSNIGEVVAIFITAILGLPEVLLPVQLLWVNLVTDGLPAVALGFNRPEDGIMEEDPRPRDEPIVGGYTLFRYMIQGFYIGVATVLGMIWWFTVYEKGPQIDYHELFDWATCNPEESTFDCGIFEDYAPNTMSLSVLVTIEMFQAINSLSERQSLFSANSHPLSNLYLLGAMSISFGLHFVILYVPTLASIFSVEPLSLHEWSIVVALATPVLLIDEFMKFFDRIRMKALLAKKLKKD
mmetsp:Transcript_5950/g.9244  ORF Transcript_5950/g.9244 Transcript_5950/m.9244 type:complete len:1044 (+) Transcript_5950:178-3309(+)|eukprot:CAMPEP_0201547502 /NCGR_PEP_ID=MMETSP0173_2-20130828/3977_1 /ASSEMBLY_ACC=CAM_ASM_000268 /TAXON_ID=218659 /ORGANISM="Vexillifera sp., Strain DIVA3 564/2" /LENGTH=1043 /DNA_ID=CAMNT_0047956571 /DNA_START=172 /DNA_END=3303 /DNA_ORIENTATION=-